MNFIYYFAFTLLSFLLLVIFRKWHDFFVLMAVAIGCAVNSFVFDPVSSSFDAGGIRIGIESTLYILFLYCLVIALRDHGYEKFKGMAESALAAIILSSLIDLSSSAIIAGEVSDTMLIKFGSYLSGAAGTALGIFFMTKIYKKLSEKKVSIYLIFISCVLETCFVESIFYYGCQFLMQKDVIQPIFVQSIAGAYVGRGIAIIFGILGYIVNHIMWHPSNGGIKHK